MNSENICIYVIIVTTKYSYCRQTAETAIFYVLSLWRSTQNSAKHCKPQLRKMEYLPNILTQCVANKQDVPFKITKFDTFDDSTCISL